MSYEAALQKAMGSKFIATDPPATPSPSSPSDPDGKLEKNGDSAHGAAAFHQV